MLILTMPIPKIEITNPQAIELIGKIKSGEILTPTKNWLKKNKIIVISVIVFVVLLIALVIGKKLSEKTPVPIYTPPDIEDVTPTISTTIKSDFSGLRDAILDLNTDVPDPFIQVFDNTITLEEPAL